MSDNPGIDYGLGSTNIDKDTGIRFGIINVHRLAHWIFDEFETDYGKPTCPNCGGEVGDDEECKKDYYCAACHKSWYSDSCYPEEPLGHTLDKDGYQAEIDSHGDVWLYKSPYYTHAQFCSPCAPGAGHLDNPCETGPKTYCWGHEYFDGDEAPYPVYDVKTNQLVTKQQ